MGPIPCRSELAREKLIGAAFIQEARVIVDVFREQARSYRVGLRCAWVYLQSWAACSSRDGLIAEANGLRSYRNTLVPSWDL